MAAPFSHPTLMTVGRDWVAVKDRPKAWVYDGAARRSRDRFRVWPVGASDACFWHIADILIALSDVRFWG